MALRLEVAVVVSLFEDLIGSLFCHILHVLDVGGCDVGVVDVQLFVILESLGFHIAVIVILAFPFPVCERAEASCSGVHGAKVLY